MSMKPLCVVCGGVFGAKRRKLGYTLCRACGAMAEVKQKRGERNERNKTD